MNTRGNGEPGRLPVALPVRESLALILMAMVVALCYANTFSNPFVFDDIPNIVENPHIRINQISLDRLAEAAFQSPLRRRPLSNLSFAANYYVGGYQPMGYHLVNTLIHIITGVLLYFVIKAAMVVAGAGSTEPGGNPESCHGGCWDGPMAGKTATLPFITAVLWAVHPLQTQSVTYLVQRMNALAAMFYVLACLLFLMAARFRQADKKWLLYAGCALSGVMALASKEMAATLPFFLLLLRWYFILDLSWPRIKREMAVVAAMAAIMAVVAFLFLGSSPLDTILAGYSIRPFTLTQRFMTEFRVIVFYVSLLIFPHPSRLNLDHHFIASASMVDPVSTLFSMVAVAGAGAAALVLAKKDRVVSFCILWYLGNLLIESSVIGLEIIFEHRNYLPSMSLVLMLVWLLYKKIRSGRVLILIFFSLAGTFAVWTYQRNLVWWDDLTLWEDCARKSPEKARPNNNLAAAFIKAEKFDEAILYCRKALAIIPLYTEAYNNLGLALAGAGRLEEATAQYLTAIELNPRYADAYNNLGLVRTKQGRWAQALDMYMAAIGTDPFNPKAYNNLGLLLMEQGRVDAAVHRFQQGLGILPRNAGLHYNLANALSWKGDWARAIGHYHRAIGADPHMAQAHNNLGIAYVRIERFDLAIGHFKAALQIDPDFKDARNNFERVMADQGKQTEGRP